MTVSEVDGGGVGRVQNVGLGPLLSYGDEREPPGAVFFLLFLSFFSTFLHRAIGIIGGRSTYFGR